MGVCPWTWKLQANNKNLGRYPAGLFGVQVIRPLSGCPLQQLVSPVLARGLPSESGKNPKNTSRIANEPAPYCDEHRYELLVSLCGTGP